MIDFESMTLDQLIAWKTAKKQEILALKEEYRLTDSAYHRKVKEAHVEEAIKQIAAAAAASGRTPEQQAWYWLIHENAEDNGHRIQAALYIDYMKGEAQ